MTINWENAPEGATDYVPENNRHHACWYKDNFKQRWLASHAARGAGGWTRASGLPESAAKPIPRPTSTAIPQTAQAEIERLRAELEAKDESIRFLDSARLGWHELYMQKKDAIERFKAGLIRAGARVPIDAMTMNPNEQGLTAALVYLESELDQAAKRKYDLASIVSRGEQDDEN